MNAFNAISQSGNNGEMSYMSHCNGPTAIYSINIALCPW